ncbi:hypothetical protein PLESTF_000474000 [Pleodorina starrii]|nr:hypothetical protein PLESTM_001764700 [Pleodorina starrii]GLC66783.1 hypothetical protein PLESTF_000474000 [Pleodorina starrii]
MGAHISSCVEPGPVFALFQAVRHGDLRVIKARLDKDPDLLTYRSLGGRDSVWHLAAAGGSEEVLGALEAHVGLMSRGELRGVVNLRNERGQTPLMSAAQSGQTAAIRWLLARGADPWATDRCGKRSALHYAVMRGRLECITTLLDSRESTQELYRYIEARTISGLTPLHYAVAMRQADAVRLLLERGADMRAVNAIADAYDLVNVPLRSTPLHVAALLNAVDCVLALLQYYHAHLAGPNFPDPRRRLDALGRTPYRVAAFRGHSGLIAELLHPSSDLGALFGREGGPGGGGGDGGAVGVPRLAALAAAVVRQQLVADVEHAEKVILDFRRRNPCCSSPLHLAKTQSTLLLPPPPPPPPPPQPPGPSHEGCSSRVSDPSAAASPSPSPSSSDPGCAPGAGPRGPPASSPSLRLAALTCAPPPSPPLPQPPPAPPGCGCDAASGQRPQQQQPGPDCRDPQQQQQQQQQPQQPQQPQQLEGHSSGPLAAPRLLLRCDSRDGGGGGGAARRRGSRDSPLRPPLRMVLPAAAARGSGGGGGATVGSWVRYRSSSPRGSSGNGSLARESAPPPPAAPPPAVPALDPDAELLATLAPAVAAFVTAGDAGTAAGAGAGAGPLAPERGCCTLRQPSPFLRRSAGYAESVFSRAPLLPVAQCAVCLEEGYCLAVEPCHHRLCGGCARHVTLRGVVDAPLPCPVCRMTVCQFTSPVC